MRWENGAGGCQSPKDLVENVEIDCRSSRATLDLLGWPGYPS